MKSTLEVLREARALYAASPCHLPGYEEVPKGQHCVYTALTAAKPVDRVFHDYAEPIRDVVGRYDLSNWNAEVSTEEVLAAFDAAIAAEEARNCIPAAPEIVPQATPRRREAVGCEREQVIA